MRILIDIDWSGLQTKNRNSGIQHHIQWGIRNRSEDGCTRRGGWYSSFTSELRSDSPVYRYERNSQTIVLDFSMPLERDHISFRPGGVDLPDVGFFGFWGQAWWFLFFWFTIPIPSSRPLSMALGRKSGYTLVPVACLESTTLMLVQVRIQSRQPWVTHNKENSRTDDSHTNLLHF